ncbi:MAG TPA: hypothetical protein VLC48_07635 [Gemmatimonadota bacterium]|nr:hypothetical protein [Gemmatimonadota bacterium]
MRNATRTSFAVAGVCLAIACSDMTGPAEPDGASPPEAAFIPTLRLRGQLAADDAWLRDFERWGPSFFNPSNYYYWPRARDDFNGHRLTFYAYGLSIFERRGRIVSDALQGRTLRAKYPAGGVGTSHSGVTFTWHLRGEYEELELSYRLKFQDDFQFTTSGKLPGLCGANDDWGCWRYSGGNKPNGDDGFTVRVVWLNGDGTMGTYVYHADQAGEFGDIFVWHDAQGQPLKITRGEWHTIRLRVKLNDPGVANGQAEAWMDGQHVSLATGLLFRDASSAGRRIKINEVYFNTFHGGRYPSDAPNQTQYAYFDELQLALPLPQVVVTN